MPVIINKSKEGAPGKKPGGKPNANAGKGAASRSLPQQPITIVALAIVIVAALAFIGWQLFGGRSSDTSQISDKIEQFRPNAARSAPPMNPGAATGTLPPNTGTYSSTDEGYSSREDEDDDGEGIR